MSRYALMLDESGVVIDDGVIARLGAEHFYFTTTTSGATAIYRELTRLNTIWRLNCGLVNLTGARSAINLAGPFARDVLAKLTDCDLSGTAFPYLAVREAQLAGIPAVLMRVGFVGEWGCEIHVAADFAPTLWNALLEAGAVYGISTFGVEAQRLLRLERTLNRGSGYRRINHIKRSWSRVGSQTGQAILHRSTQFTNCCQAAAQTKIVGFTLDLDFCGQPQKMSFSD
jgi:sarcosine oxidase subunit alpha